MPFWYLFLEHLHPDALKGLGKPFDAALEKNLPHPSPIPQASKQARAIQTSGSTPYPRGWALLLLRPHSGASSTCDLVNRATFGNQEHYKEYS